MFRCPNSSLASAKPSGPLLAMIGILCFSWAALGMMTGLLRAQSAAESGSPRAAKEEPSVEGPSEVAGAVDSVEPQWIWGSPGADREAEAGRCDFRRTFTLEEARSGRLDIACDNHYVVRLNGRLIGLGDQWKQWTSYDVSPFLVIGENRIQVRCRNEGGPAGLAVRLALHGSTAKSSVNEPRTNGGAEWIVTNGQWEARLQQAGTWDPSIDSRTPWVPATELGRVGSAAPWGEVAGASTLIALPTRRASGESAQMQDGDRILLLGSTLIERAQRYGDWEALWTAAFPDKRLVFRNLGWSGDTVFGHARARFGSVQDGFDHLETHVYGEQPDWIVVAYGTNESYAGEAGLESFREGLENLLDVLEGTGARILLMSPPPCESSAALPDPTVANANLRLYRDAIAEEAGQRGYPLIDLFTRLPEWSAKYTELQPLTDNGLHLDANGYWVTSQVIAAELKLLRNSVRVEVDLTTRTMKTNGCYADQLQATPAETRFSVRGQAVPIPAPASSTASTCWLRVVGLKPGNYQLFIDDKPVARAKSDEWAAGVSLKRGPELDQAEALKKAIAQKNDLYFHRWRPQNETYLFLFRKHEQGNNAVEIPQFDPLIDEVEQRIAELRAPRTHGYVLRAD